MKTVIKSYKVRIYPNKTVEESLYRNIGQVRFVFNQLKETMDRDYQYIRSRGLQPKLVNRRYLNIRLNELKSEYKWLRESDSTSLQATYEILIIVLSDFSRVYPGSLSIRVKRTLYSQLKLKNNHSNTIRVEGNRIRLISMVLLGFVITGK